ncbi:MAG: penicillin-binding protein 1C [Bacteroidales bacterium]|nr:penicillin-binding protein 1C [Bacteroidales bacterium]
MNFRSVIPFLRKYWWAFLLFVGFVFYWFSLPSTVIDKPMSTVVLSSDGRLLSARLAADGQWRFPAADSLPDKLKTCVLYFEDRHFYKHPGINPVSLVKAISRNIKAGRTVSGGSTITMQVARISLGNRNRTLKNKLLEMIRATRIELSYSKQEILSLWLNNAPFGGNIVGIEAASRRYFNRSAFQLSWAESATVAVLPNAPSLIYIGKNQKLLLEKRNRLLKKLYDYAVIDQLTYDLSIAEPLPEKLFSLPNIAPHLTDLYNRNSQRHLIKSSIDYNLQLRIAQTVQPSVEELVQTGIGNVAILVVKVETGEVVAYHGNLTSQKNPAEYDHFVDIMQAPRSSGSTLKPFLYASAFDRGLLMPSTLVQDIPTFYGNYHPVNFDEQYSGLSPAAMALATSLNIPAVRLLQSAGIPHFHKLLQDIGFTTITQNPDFYGLSLILGGAEVTLFELTGAYSSMARVLKNYHSKGYQASDWHSPIITKEKKKEVFSSKHEIISASAIYETFYSLLDANRPANETGWKLFSSTRKIAWKTGTSFGLRDAWSVGVNPDYVVGVWSGNANGEGRPGLTGLTVAAPLMFKVFDLLPESGWFEKPEEEMIRLKICSKTGFKAGPNCLETKEILADRNADLTAVCPYHKLLHLDSTLSYQVNSSCESVSNIRTQPWLVFPPVEEYYYQQQHHDYQSAPPFRYDCAGNREAVMEFVYPIWGAKITLTKDMGGEEGEIIFKVAHRNKLAKVFWHLDNQFLGTTENIHDLMLKPDVGNHWLTVTDQEGNTKTLKFSVVGSED